MLDVTWRWSNLADGNNEEGPSSAGFDDDGDEFGVDRTEGTVPRHAGHSDIVDAVLGFPRLGEDVPELTLPDHTSSERHVCYRGRRTTNMKRRQIQQGTVERIQVNY